MCIKNNKVPSIGYFFLRNTALNHLNTKLIHQRLIHKKCQVVIKHLKLLFYVYN